MIQILSCRWMFHWDGLHYETNIASLLDSLNVPESAIVARLSVPRSDARPTPGVAQIERLVPGQHPDAIGLLAVEGHGYIAW